MTRRMIGPRGAISALALTGLLIATAPPAFADVCDLTTSGSNCGPGVFGVPSGNNNLPPGWAMSAIFQQIAPQPTGTAVVDNFLRIQHSPNEVGFNTDYRPLPSSMNTFDPNNTIHALHISEIPVVALNTGTSGSPQWANYREFYLDINETTSLPRISLDQLQIFLGPNASFNSYSSGKLNGVSPIYDLDTGSDNYIKLSYSLNLNNPGTGDMVAYIPDSLFTNTQANPYVYLYSGFGFNWSSDGGFEEWFTKNAQMYPTPTPEPASLLLLGSGLILAARGYRRKSARRGPNVIEEPTKVTLTADLASGNA